MKQPQRLRVLLLMQIAFVVAMVESVARAADPSAASFVGTKAGQVRDDNSLKMKLVWCPSGRFTEGDVKAGDPPKDVWNPVEVTLTKGYWLAMYEVTQGQWERVMRTRPWRGKECVKNGEDYAATYVDWTDAMEFCRKLTEVERSAGRLPSGWKYTLPTEAQWEYACRAGTTTRFSFGDKDSLLGDYAWFHNNTEEASDWYAHRIGLKKSNSWGFYDMHGNVWEWCRDWFEPTIHGGINPQGPSSGSDRVNRGGSWRTSGELSVGCGSAERGWQEPDAKEDDVGFRVALEQSAK